jgi:hypothetical protein
MDWITYDVTLTGITELLGGMPKTQALIEGQMSSKEIRLKAKALGRDPERIIAENLNAMGLEDGLDEITDEEKMSCGFRKTADGSLALGSHQIPAMLIDAATTLRYSRKHIGLKDLLTRGLVVLPLPLVPIHSTGEQVSHPTTILEWGSQIKDRMGTRAILRRYDAIMPWALHMTVQYPDTGLITKAIWSDLWEMGGHQGLGAARPRGYGKFVATWER